ncbi:serine O-acetyltransferase [Brevundimonas sp.]|uniref:serine O-acetyltransferase n=1 Tax=Brevundimonas sp. TaxID=1871086 RepID=UPI0035B0D577
MNAIHLYRLGHFFHRRGVPGLPGLIKGLIFLLYNSAIPPSATIGRGSVFAYGAIGVVIHSDAVIGAGCVIGQGITIGAAEAYASPERKGCPRIGDDVYIAAGARIIGDITIGDRCIIGAGAIVTRSVPDGSVVAGVPARVIGATPPGYRAIRG